uniref:ABC transporter permease n=1 Tax=Ignisphaera aggregans TaxID=334771 RepID=A0A7C4FGZ7_9CREN
MLYDFKRGVLRVSVLVTLALFVLAGVGMAYVLVAVMATMPSSQNQVLYSYIDTSTGEFKLEAVLLDPELRPVGGEVSYTLGCYNKTKLRQLEDGLRLGKITPEEYQGEFEKLLRVVDEGSVRSASGRVSLVKMLSEAVSRDYGCKLYLNITTVYGTSTQAVRMGLGQEYLPLEIGNKTILTLVSTPGIPSISSIEVAGESITIAPQPTHATTPITVTMFQVGELKGFGVVSASLYAVSYEKSVLLIALHSSVDTEFTVYIERLNASDMPSELSLSSIEKYFERVGVVRSGVSIVELDVNLLRAMLVPVKPSLNVVLLSRKGNTTMLAVARATTNVLQTEYAKKVISMQLAGPTGVSMFITFFPVVVLYLVYIYVAKPRSQGALEFVLARPITRFELYITRLFAGVLVVLTATALFYTALVLAIYFLTGVLLDLYSFVLLFAGLALALIAFYSLCYLLSVLTSGTRYLVASIMTYIVFAILWPLLVYLVIISFKGFTLSLAEELAKAQYISYYFTPLGVHNFMQYYYLVYVGGGQSPAIEAVISPWLVGISTATWIIAPVAIGWLLFKKANLSS